MSEKKENLEQLSIGQILKHYREKVAMSLDEVSTELKIKKPDIIALEHDTFKGSSHLYLTGFIKSYAKLLKIDKKLIEEKIKELSIDSNVNNKKHNLVNLDRDEIKSPDRETFFNSILLLIILYLLLISFHQFSTKNLITTESIMSELSRVE